MKEFDIITVTEDINSAIKKGMQGVILEVYNNGEAFEVEFVTQSGKNISLNGRDTFTIPRNKLKKSKSV